MRQTIAAAVVAAMTLAGCSSATSSGTGERAETAVAKPALPDVAEQVSGPQSPIAYGFEVPRGAKQLGPLIRYRSADLIATYEPELQALIRQRIDEAEAERLRAIEAGETPKPIPTITSTPTNRPGRDTFRELTTPPSPDITVSTMRVDGNPTKVMQRVLAQVNAVIPEADVDVNDLSRVCTAEDQRIVECSVSASGSTADGRTILFQATMDPGNLQTRTGYAMSDEDPVLVMKVVYTGDVRLGQQSKPEIVDVPADVETDDRSELVWPRMDLDAPVADAAVEGWEVSDAGQLLLHGERPPFAIQAAPSVAAGKQIAKNFAASFGEPTVDIVEDLNEITTTYRTTTERGTALGAFVLTARGSYAATFFWPTRDDS